MHTKISQKKKKQQQQLFGVYEINLSVDFLIKLSLDIDILFQEIVYTITSYTLIVGAPRIPNICSL